MTRTEIVLINTPLNAGKIMKMGYQPTIYDDVPSAIEGLKHRIMIGSRLPDVIISGYERINFSFSELAGWLEGREQQIPVLLCENKIDQELLNDAKDNKVKDVIIPEIETEILKNKIDLLIGQTSTKSSINLDSKSIGTMKRLFDIIVASVLLLLLSPLFLIVIAAIKIESKGAAFYWQKRVGTGYKVFNFYKFRSMRTDADSMVDQLKNNNHYASKELEIKESALEIEGTMLIDDSGKITEAQFLNKKVEEEQQAFFKVQNDPRITKVGHFIRKTSIDELPQLLNVLIGDMSIVGNRPLPLYEAEKLTDDLWAERFMAPAGITGLWQVTERGKANTSLDSRKMLDITYARTNSFWGDIKILIKTPLAALQQENV